MVYGTRFDGSDDDDFCEECGGDGCWECGGEDQCEFVQCRGITQRGTRCRITSDSANGFGKFADAAYPLTCGSYYCTFHTQQEWERDESDECWECGGEGCPECCFECDGRGCEECEEEWGYAASSSQQRQAYQTPAAIPAAPSQDEVAIVGYRSRQERDAEARRHASTPHAHLQVGNLYAHSHGSSQNTMHTHMSQTPAYTHVSKMHRLPLEHGGVA